MPPLEDKLLKGTWWFPLRKYVPGWGPPVCWQGWLVVVVYGILLVGAAPFFLPWHKVYYAAYLVALTAALYVVVWEKGEPVR